MIIKHTQRHKKAHNINTRKTINNVMRWVLFSWLLTVFPPMINIVYRTILGLNFYYYLYIADLSILVLAICCNFISICVDEENHVHLMLKWLIGIFFGMICLGCWGLYLIIEMSKKDDPLEFFKIHYVFTEYLFKSFIGIIIFVLIAGIFIIIKSATSTNRIRK